ncbi:hypothetical protein RhiirA5_423393 [Rhizophagus irregularis]|uniref:Uncharacterized protein n=2 Tax=Rhizophagus irregularis TaxID=588596 RepID=A0A2I1F146_9GLOM|nr:hypothetical protein GLOIN_2v1790028 [Rhizophagus irregularis DAOM 181602=DAOM 197198]PKC03682.1 hypothetical protein RhiirA5_423393 [Rhizophagus irregularis]PKY28098.1 hypothetical protein RhiirB3_444099 [Rhizophagus irregularis]POG58699.1 hypothetical protein GLOIN_2v1790028 [Rhizophagus irregularis DAOM 181602=DAOM 197198]CAB5144564.1 unnamed protein product [Rhizophagus irregularis]CAB5343492.1 unnamed protein product [Rhizophagus irregularis]|eukprot:XP_025165565.1 hypothetical protein GLOIN_2v1790028 [Rhizophagus irregularis DAOM 181602=DAOM 197198]
MEQPSVTYSDNQSLNYLSQTYKWIDTNIVSSHKEVCKELDICQEKLREEHEQKRQEIFNKSSLHSQQLSQKVTRQLHQFQLERKCSLYQRKNIDSEQTPLTNPSSYRTLRKRRNLRKLRHTNIYTLRQSNHPFVKQIFYGSNFY